MRTNGTMKIVRSHSGWPERQLLTARATKTETIPFQKRATPTMTSSLIQGDILGLSWRGWAVPCAVQAVADLVAEPLTEIPLPVAPGTTAARLLRRTKIKPPAPNAANTSGMRPNHI